MSFWLMMLVGFLYSAAALAYLWEDKPGWAVVVAAWATSNFALALLSSRG